MKEKKTFGIWELSDEASEVAVSETIRVLNYVLLTGYTPRDNQKEAYWVARCFNARFDEDGHLENRRIFE